MRYLLILVIIFSCAKKENAISPKQLDAIDSISFQLDSLTPDYFHGLELVVLNDQPFLSLLNDLTNTIYYYDVRTGKFNKKLSFKVGGDGLMKGVMTFKHVGSDSIFLFGKGRYSYLSDHLGNIINDFELMDLSIRQSPYATSSSPPIIFGDYIYYNSIVWGDYSPEFHPILRYSISKGDVSLANPYPRVYFQEGDWGALPYDYIYQAFDRQNNRIIYSFPNSNVLYERRFGLDSLIEVKQSEFGEKIKPPFESNNYEYDSETWHETLNNLAIFGPVYIDEVSEVILRFYILPVKSNLKSPKRKMKLIKYNLEDLEILNVYDLPEKDYVATNAFFYNSNFYLRKKSGDEDSISFDLFKY